MSQISYIHIGVCDRIAAMTLEINEEFPEIRAYYKKEPKFHMPSEWGSHEEQTILSNACS
jgi:hypothetical protein